MQSAWSVGVRRFGKHYEACMDRVNAYQQVTGEMPWEPIVKEYGCFWVVCYPHQDCRGAIQPRSSNMDWGDMVRFGW